MEQYIDKVAVVAEIKRILSAFENSDAPVDRLRASILIGLLSFINTLEVKDVKEVTAADRGMAEEIIINLKRVENDYKIDLTREMEWLRNFLAQKGEKNMTRKEVENLKERFKPIHDSGRRMFGSEAYDSHIKEVLKVLWL